MFASRTSLRRLGQLERSSSNPRAAKLRLGCLYKSYAFVKGLLALRLLVLSSGVFNLRLNKRRMLSSGVFNLRLNKRRMLSFAEQALPLAARPTECYPPTGGSKSKPAAT